MGPSRAGNPSRRRATPIPVAPPRIPTPMPLGDNNNAPRSGSKEQDVVKSSSEVDVLITKSSYRVLDNDVKTAWINPRLISKIDIEKIKRNDYHSNTSQHPTHRSTASSHHHQQLPKPSTCGRNHEREWETVGGRAKMSTRLPVPSSTLPQQDGKRKGKPKIPMDAIARAPRGKIRQEVTSKSGSAGFKGVVGFQRQQSACFVEPEFVSPNFVNAGGGFSGNEGVYGVYAETKQFVFAVNQAQASAAAAFFARASQKLNLSASPHRKKRYSLEEGDGTGFCGALQRTPPPVPPALLRKIGVKEVTGIGKVKVMLRVSKPPGCSSEGGGSNSFFSLDKRKKQVTLTDPAVGSGSAAPEDRRVGVAAPKMFAFDAVFSHDDSQTEVCSSALSDVIHAVINGTDGCLFCFGHAGLGKSYTMLGTAENANTLGIIPCAISWLFKGINEQKQKTGARFSVRISAVEICGPSNQLRDLLAGYSNDSEQSPGVYLRDDPLFGSQPPHCELRVPTAEKAAHYLDSALESRSSTKEDTRDSHLLCTLHVYQYSVAGKGGVAGGRSRLHLFDLGNSDRSKASGGIPLSGLGNVILAIFNNQRHLPYKEHKLAQLMKECLGSLTCHAAMIAHVSPAAANYSDTLTTVQLASRVHRMRRRRIKFVATGAGNGSGGSSGEEATRTTGTSSEPDPSSSDLSADTVIYVGGRADDATDGEHPPVYIPSLNSGDNRCSMTKALRGSSAEQKVTQSPRHQRAEEKTTPHRASVKSSKTSPAHSGTPKQSPSRIPSLKSKTEPSKLVGNGCSDEQWIDGPRISKSKVAEGIHLRKEASNVKKCETWIDGPMQQENRLAYGYMDSHKKNMIRQWVEHQTIQIQKTKHPSPRTAEVKSAKEPPKELTQFKSTEEEEAVRKKIKSNQALMEETEKELLEDLEDEDEPVLPPALPLIQPLSSREVSLESLDQLLKERMLSNAEYNSYQKSSYEDEDEVLEIIEVEEPLEPVPTQDSCLQVTEEDIALCMGYAENPLPEVDQGSPFDHPLRVLSQENLTVVSTFTDSMSVFNDLERLLPRFQMEQHGFYHDYEDPDNGNPNDESIKKLNQLTRLHELYTDRLAQANLLGSERRQERTLTRCESLSLTDMLYGGRKPVGDDSSIYSEPAYVQEKFCENCKVNMARPSCQDTFSFSSTRDLAERHHHELSSRFQRYNHKYRDNLEQLRHPDGASEPNLAGKSPGSVLPGDSITSQPMPPPNSLPSVERISRAILSLETGVTAVKLGQKSEGYDSGHDSTPRTSKHSPAAISRRAESGYDSIVRDSESSSIDSEPSRMSHCQGRRGKCKHKHDKSFCSWFLNPFTCKYIDEPPETHF